MLATTFESSRPEFPFWFPAAPLDTRISARDGAGLGAAAIGRASDTEAPTIGRGIEARTATECFGADCPGGDSNASAKAMATARLFKDSTSECDRGLDQARKSLPTFSVYERRCFCLESPTLRSSQTLSGMRITLILYRTDGHDATSFIDEILVILPIHKLAYRRELGAMGLDWRCGSRLMCQ